MTEAIRQRWFPQARRPGLRVRSAGPAGADPQLADRRCSVPSASGRRPPSWKVLAGVRTPTEVAGQLANSPR